MKWKTEREREKVSFFTQDFLLAARLTRVDRPSRDQQSEKKGNAFQAESIAINAIQSSKALPKVAHYPFISLQQLHHHMSPFTSTHTEIERHWPLCNVLLCHSVSKLGKPPHRIYRPRSSYLKYHRTGYIHGGRSPHRLFFVDWDLVVSTIAAKVSHLTKQNVADKAISC